MSISSPTRAHYNQTSAKHARQEYKPLPAGPCAHATSAAESRSDPQPRSCGGSARAHTATLQLPQVIPGAAQLANLQLPNHRGVWRMGMRTPANRCICTFAPSNIPRRCCATPVCTCTRTCDVRVGLSKRAGQAIAVTTPRLPLFWQESGGHLVAVELATVERLLCFERRREVLIPAPCARAPPPNQHAAREVPVGWARLLG